MKTSGVPNCARIPAVASENARGASSRAKASSCSEITARMAAASSLEISAADEGATAPRNASTRRSARATRRRTAMRFCSRLRSLRHDRDTVFPRPALPDRSSHARRSQGIESVKPHPAAGLRRTPAVRTPFALRGPKQALGGHPGRAGPVLGPAAPETGAARNRAQPRRGARAPCRRRQELRRLNSVEEYRGRSIMVRFDGSKCIHSRHCVLEQPAVFEGNVSGPWIHPDASPEGAVEVAHRCPSGAITYERTDGGPQETAPLVNTAHVRENGPLAFRAELVVGGRPAGIRATLCRCGASKNKPWCDTSHVAAGFKASGEPATQGSEPLEKRNGPLAIMPTKNGPLQVTGSLEICSGTGRTVLRTRQTSLCRCGGSSNKPFCDGTHAKIGFTG